MRTCNVPFFTVRVEKKTRGSKIMTLFHPFFLLLFQSTMCNTRCKFNQPQTAFKVKDVVEKLFCCCRCSCCGCPYCRCRYCPCRCCCCRCHCCRYRCSGPCRRCRCCRCFGILSCLTAKVNLRVAVCSSNELNFARLLLQVGLFTCWSCL